MRQRHKYADRHPAVLIGAAVGVISGSGLEPGIGVLPALAVLGAHFAGAMKRVLPDRQTQAQTFQMACQLMGDAVSRPDFSAQPLAALLLLPGKITTGTK